MLCNVRKDADEVLDAGAPSGQVDVVRDKLLLHLVLHVAQLADARVRAELADVGVSHEQGRYLDALAHAGPVSVTRLATALGVAQPSVTTMVARLGDLGLVAKRPDPSDGRANLVELTPHGAERASAVRDAWRRVDRDLLAGVASREEKSLHAAMLALRDHLGGRSPDLDESRAPSKLRAPTSNTPKIKRSQ